MVGLILPVRADQLAGVADPNDVCKFQFGPGYRMAEFHDGEITTGGNGAWNFYASGSILMINHLIVGEKELENHPIEMKLILMI